ncbi:AMP-binding protein [Sphingopyxis granuli]|uniref:AMP-binding protein n=1 Tax=Sphingopyxis granuli TaxID=267128 RepID=UPI00301E2919
MPRDSLSATQQFAPVEIEVEERPGGVRLLRSQHKWAGTSQTIIDRLVYWASLDPGAVLVAERDGSDWRHLTYGEAWSIAGAVASELRQCGCSGDHPLLILAGNGIAHAIYMLAAFRAGVPVAPISTAYAAYGTFDRLRLVVEISRAKAAFVGAEISADARDAIAGMGLQLLGLPPQAAKGDEGPAGHETIGPDTIAKLMFTSGSTGTPKAVIVTHGMMAANQEQLAAVWPTPVHARPRLVDWLPWNHTFGGNFVFNMALWNGGALYIDDGRPAPGLVERTLAALQDVRPTRYFSVPAGYEILVPALEAAPDRAKLCFENLEFAFCAAAALSQSTRDRLAALLRTATGREIPILGGWGSTETAPCSTAVHFENELAGNIGLPLPGVSIKMVPTGGRTELRIKGPNVFPGYWHAPDATKKAFDDDGYYCIGDAGRFVDPDRPERGLAFDGRVAENFKLQTGTWVTVGSLRMALVEAARPWIQDAVITGHGRSEIGALLFVNETHCREALDLGPEDLLSECLELREIVREKIDHHNKTAGGSSMRIERFRIEDMAPSPDRGEMTDKGYINQSAVLSARCDSVEDLYARGSCRTSSPASADR